ncbi:vitellogenin-like isoform X2 [Bradysia coprophila]|nr:vitellogenin-like isoform X2 [Bradysia coprophila]
MKGALLFTAILAGLVAVRGHWERNKVYKYEVKAKILKYSPESGDESSGLYSRYHLTLRPHSDDVIIGQLTQAEFFKGRAQRYNAMIQDSSDSGSDANFENSPLSKPFKINLRNGVIQSLGVDDSLSYFGVNQLKLIMNQFQVDTTRLNVNSLSENQLPQADSNTAFYKTAESTGHCETIYDISPIPDYLVRSNPEWVPLPEMIERNGEIIEIVKTKTSANCEGRRNVLDAASNYLSGKGVRENDLSIVERQRIVASVGSVHRFTIQSTITANKLMYTPQNMPLITVYVNSSLESVESASQRPTNLPDNLTILENLSYDFNPKMDEYQPIQSRLERDGTGTEYRYTTSCWKYTENPTYVCNQEFGKDWSFAGHAKNCNPWGMLYFECKRD